MPLALAEWTRHAGIAEAVAYCVYGLPSEKRTIIAMRPGGWRVVRNTLVQFDHGRVYSTAEEAASALKAWIEGGEQPTKAEE
jgi:monoamine oxidase